MVYDITNPESFKGAKSWVKELQRRGDPSVIIALAGNKADLASRRKVCVQEGEGGCVCVRSGVSCPPPHLGIHT